MYWIKHVVKSEKSPAEVWYPFATKKDAVLQAKYDITMVSGVYEGVYEGSDPESAKKIHGKELP